MTERQLQEGFWTLYRALAQANVGLHKTANGVSLAVEQVLRSLKEAGALSDYRTYGETDVRTVRMEVSSQWTPVHYTFDVRTLTREWIPVAEVLWS